MKLKLSPGALFVFSCVYFFDGLSGLAAVLISVLVHEAGHALAINACGGRVKSVRADSAGLCMQSFGVYGTAQELFVLLAGPMAGLALALVCSHIGRLCVNVLLLKTAGISLLLTAYNLLPALPLDGGRALYAAVGSLFGSKCADIVLYMSGMLCGVLLSAVGIIKVDRIYGLVLLAVGVRLLCVQTGLVKSMRLM